MKAMEVFNRKDKESMLPASETDFLQGPKPAGNIGEPAFNVMDSANFLLRSVTVKRKTPGGGIRISAETSRGPLMDIEMGDSSAVPTKGKIEVSSILPSAAVKVEEAVEIIEVSSSIASRVKIEGATSTPSDDPGLVPNAKVEEDEISSGVKTQHSEEAVFERIDGFGISTRVKAEEAGSASSLKTDPAERPAAVEEDNSVCDENSVCVNVRPISFALPQTRKLREELARPPPVLVDEDFPLEDNWLHVGSTCVSGLSTCRGRRIVCNEVVDFEFPRANRAHRGKWVSSKAAAAASEIVRFSTKRSGEIGRLPSEWTRCLIPLVQSSKAKIRGRCIFAPGNLNLMQEIVLYISLYIHTSIFTDGDLSSWKLMNPSLNDSTLSPLPTLFKLLKLKPFKKADFTPEELDKRNRKLHTKSDDASNEFTPTVPIQNRKRGTLVPDDENGEEQILSDKDVSKLVGTADAYNLEERDPPGTLLCDLKPYQKQALHWMCELEKGLDAENAEKTLHPCWDGYTISDKRASAVYVNVFSGEATTEFPSAVQMARGGILADAMGLGKTVMAIALILTKPSWKMPSEKDEFKGFEDVSDTYDMMGYEYVSKRAKSESNARVKCGTLVICPMAILGQWKNELENHCEAGALSVFVHYGQDRTENPRVLAEYDVVLTTYGVLTSAYKCEYGSIFHKVEWYRVVLDEAHTIKSSKTQAAQAAFALSAYCRWCLTGTPLQNKLEDLYSLLCFLHVDPWSIWAWWQKLIQGPYENGDERGLKLVKAILRPLMLRRTKDSTDKNGRPILVLPPVDVQVIECEQSEAEWDFYMALFKRSKVQFDQFVQQGKILQNYASILELLLRLRQCCNHPFLVMSRADTQKYSDMSKLAKRFLSGNPNQDAADSSAPTRAYVEQVVEAMQCGETSECPICFELPEDAVLTPCAHSMCRECLLSCWRTAAGGPCPICRTPILKQHLMTCPSDSRFTVDINNNWKDSAKVSALMNCLEAIHISKSREKSIVFSQWTAFMDLLEVPLKKKGIAFLRFDGKLSQPKREKILLEFNESTDKRVLLMSLKAGGVGLNLTAASNVFLVDPWWNPAVEDQAIMRIHRIGQKRRVLVRRFIVKESVEERMQQVQARKQRMIAGALTDGEMRTARIEELKMLFR